MESFVPIEDRIFENARDADTVTLKNNVNKLWNIWVSNVPALKRADSVAVYLRQSPIAPESTHVVLKNNYLLQISRKDRQHEK